MRLLLIHNETDYFGGAEQLLGHFLKGLERTDIDVTVAAVEDSRVARLIPTGLKCVGIVDNHRFFPLRLWQQAWSLVQMHRTRPFDLLHGWAARDWELTALTGRLLGRPAIATLHDHPQARFFSPKRHQLLRWSAQYGLQQVVCVSAAVQDACKVAGYRADRLSVIHNGLPAGGDFPRRSPHNPFRFGFLGVISERKGLRSLFAILNELAQRTPFEWEMHLAGEAQESTGQQLLKDIALQYRKAAWWPQVHWHGWVNDPFQFLKTIDILICPSSEFEPFGLVLCEAGLSGIPVVATRVGGIPEIVQDGVTGWLYDPGDCHHAAQILCELLAKPDGGLRLGEAAFNWVSAEFGLAKMVAAYRKLYSKVWIRACE